MEKPTLEAEVEGLGEVHKIVKPFDEGYSSLRAIHAKLIALRDLSYGRIKTGKEHSLSTNGSWVMEGGLLRKKQLPLLLRKSLVLAHPKDAVNAHRAGHEYSVDKETEKKYSDIAEKDKTEVPEKRRALILSSRETYRIPTDEFDKHDETRWVFLDQAQDYGKFLRSAGIKEMPILLDSADYVDEQKSSYATQLWLHGLESDSGLDARSRSWYYNWLNNDNTLRGVRAEGAKLTSEAGSQIIKPYTQADLDEFDKAFSGLEGILNQKLLDAVTKLRKKL